MRRKERMYRTPYRRIVDRVLDAIGGACTNRGNTDCKIHPYRLQDMLLAAVDTDDRLTDKVFDEDDVHPPGQFACRGRVERRSGARHPGCGASAGETSETNGIDTVHGVLRRSAANNQQTS